jgi:hypothetical protein
MKKIILLSMLAMMLFSGNSFATEMNSKAVAGPGVWFKLLINFHRPKMDCERGFGICFVFSWGIEEPDGYSEKNLCLAKGQINDRNQLIIEVSEASLASYENGSTLPYFKDKASISILDPYTFTDATCKALGSFAPKTIKPGNYPVSYQNGVYTIVFQL